MTTGGDTTTMDEAAQGATQKPATAARIYDYYLGGIHNFPADQEVARKVIAQCPFIPAGARANRAFLRRAVRHLADAGVRQFLDIGSGIPTKGNVHEIAQGVAPDSRVVYVDIDPVAVAESLEILDGNQGATAIRVDLRSPQFILDHPDVRRLLDFDQPIGLLLAAVLHFVPDDAQAHDVVTQLVAALAPGSYLVVSHAATESFPPSREQSQDAGDVYKRRPRHRPSCVTGPRLSGSSRASSYWTQAWSGCTNGGATRVSRRSSPTSRSAAADGPAWVGRSRASTNPHGLWRSRRGTAGTVRSTRQRAEG